MGEKQKGLPRADLCVGEGKKKWSLRPRPLSPRNRKHLCRGIYDLPLKNQISSHGNSSISWAGGKDQTTQQTFGEKKQQQNQEGKKSAASKATHIQLVTQVLPEPGLEAGIESVKERFTHAMVWQSWLLPAHWPGTQVLQQFSPQHTGLLGLLLLKNKQTGALSLYFLLCCSWTSKPGQLCLCCVWAHGTSELLNHLTTLKTKIGRYHKTASLYLHKKIKAFVSCSFCLWDQQSIASSTPRAGLTKRCCWFCLLSWSNTIWFGLRKGGSSAWCWSLKDSEDKSVRDSAPGMACGTEEEVTSLLLHWSTTKKTSFQVGPFQSSDRKLNDPVGSTATLSAFLYEWDGHWGGLSW